MKLSKRLRPNVECAPWVIEGVKVLEERVRVLEEAIATAIPKLRQIASDQYQYDMAKYIADDLRALAGGKGDGV